MKRTTRARRSWGSRRRAYQERPAGDRTVQTTARPRGQSELRSVLDPTVVQAIHEGDIVVTTTPASEPIENDGISGPFGVAPGLSFFRPSQVRAEPLDATPLAGRTVWVCENPVVTERAEAALGSDAGPLVCVEGWMNSRCQAAACPERGGRAARLPRRLRLAGHADRGGRPRPLPGPPMAVPRRRLPGRHRGSPQWPPTAGGSPLADPLGPVPHGGDDRSGPGRREGSRPRRAPQRPRPPRSLRTWVMSGRPWSTQESVQKPRTWQGAT